MKNNNGFSLVEICIATCVTALLIGVGAYQYSKYYGTAEKKGLKDSAEIFALSMKKCIVTSGGWKVKTWLSTDTTEPSQDSKPCEAKTETELENKLNFKCPNEVTCNGYVKAVDAPEVFCLSMQKTIQGKNHQVMVKFDINEKSWDVYCGQPSTYHTLTDTTCVASLTWTDLTTPCAW